MNLPTRCCYVKVQGKEAVKITSLKVNEPRIDQKELAAVLGEYKHRYQRSKEEASLLLQKEEADRQAFYGNFPTQAQSVDTASDYSDRFHNPFEKRNTPQNKEKGVD
jgi:hypothetical protein